MNEKDVVVGSWLLIFAVIWWRVFSVEIKSLPHEIILFPCKEQKMLNFFMKKVELSLIL